MKLFRKKKVTKDRNFEKHTSDCPFRNQEITLIDNFRGKKIHESYRRYCPYCGTKVR